MIDGHSFSRCSWRVARRVGVYCSFPVFIGAPFLSLRLLTQQSVIYLTRSYIFVGYWPLSVY